MKGNLMKKYECSYCGNIVTTGSVQCLKQCDECSYCGWIEVKEEEPGPLHAPMIQRHKDGRPITFGDAAKVERLRDMQHVIRADLVDALNEKDEEIERLNNSAQAGAKALDKLRIEWFDFRSKLNEAYLEIRSKDDELDALEKELEEKETAYSIELSELSKTDVYNEAVDKANQEILKNRGELIDKVDEVLALLKAKKAPKKPAKKKKR